MRALLVVMVFAGGLAAEPLFNGRDLDGWEVDTASLWTVRDGMISCLYDESRRKRVLAQAAPESLKGLDKTGWNEYVITARGPRITLELNGVTTVDYTETETGMETSGFIALQVHGGPPMEVRFKDLDIEILR